MKRILFLLLIIIYQSAQGQGTDSVSNVRIPVRIRAINPEAIDLNGIHYQKIDTEFVGQNATNPAMRSHYNFLGTLNSAAEPQLFKFSDKLFSDLTITGYDQYMYKPDSVYFLRTNKRYTNIDYHTGSFKEQEIELLHSQNITKNWNAGIRFNRAGVKDFMNFSSTFRNKIMLNTWYQSNNKRYNLFAAFIWNYIKNGVNGGISDDSLFLNTDVNNLGIKGLPYRIAGAQQRNRYRSFSVNQFYKLVGDTTTSGKGLLLNHKVVFDRKTFAYADKTSDSTFYNDFFNGTETYDSLSYSALTNTFALEAKPFRFPATLRGFVDYQNAQYKNVTDTNWSNLALGGRLIYENDTALTLSFEAKYVLAGLDKQNLSLKGFANFRASDNLALNVDAGFMNSAVNFFLRNYSGNNFKWSNDFNSQKHTFLHSSVHLEKLNLKVGYDYHLLTNAVYVNELGSPEQSSGTFYTAKAYLSSKIKYRSLHFDNNFYYQKTSATFIRIPEFVTDQHLYIQNSYFSNNLIAAYGLRGSFNTAFFANDYMPSTSLFFIQNELKTGGFYRMDVFVNLKIRAATIFVIMENAADGLTGNSYYLTPHYPMPGRVLKFGLVWNFYD